MIKQAADGYSVKENVLRLSNEYLGMKFLSIHLITYVHYINAGSILNKCNGERRRHSHGRERRSKIMY
jgi:hypothetical protein